MVRVAEALVGIEERLAAAGCPRPGRDAQRLVAAALAVDTEHLESLRLDDVTSDRAERLSGWVERRASREPLEYILGCVRCGGIEVLVNRHVHIPRFDRTGLLMYLAVQLPTAARVHEVGTGSGAVALAIKHERPDLTVSGSDISGEAIEVAKENARRLRLDVHLYACTDIPEGDFDLVIACLPYSAERELTSSLAPETSCHQPRIAIVSGPDGLEAIRQLVASAPAGMRMALEHAPFQAAAVRALMKYPVTMRDEAGLDRATVGLKSRGR